MRHSLSWGPGLEMQRHPDSCKVQLTNVRFTRFCDSGLGWFRSSSVFMARRIGSGAPRHKAVQMLRLRLVASSQQWRVIWKRADDERSIHAECWDLRLPRWSTSITTTITAIITATFCWYYEYCSQYSYYYCDCYYVYFYCC